jgi:Protein of unknown function (DUF4240)
LYVDAGTKDLFAAACLINASGSDDNFWYFLGWLLSQGRALFEVAIGDPDRLADHFRRQGITAATCGDNDRWPYWCQAIEYAADDAYQAVTGLELPLPEEEAAAPPHPSPWYIDRLDGPDLDLGDAEQLRQRLPRLWALFGPEATD